ncbi:PREDICTED: orphan sodium- and chloride-dependent neurotransmitter transporter NTT5-like [Elephantulus edwardii]|uniref:orphan sodium- and chloride-dependent neurotransmitter transporter NTT5-like n=1 Tax=Elephantulus edwardii TaxID=28737 RepID=UPI0003F0A07B|nr:PREDICTED: orphan sodium- and chloride-dependent neurotransmitter transporter NTT5-like [Elephantulus edwardii]
MTLVEFSRHETSSQPEQGTKKKKHEDVSRPLWSSKVEYILTQVGYTVRLTNLWIFPQLWYLNGGVFIIIYTFMLFVIGVPILFMEMAFGQRLRQNGLTAWKFTSPWMTGLGYTIFMVCFVRSLYSNVMNCWSLFYFVQSFTFPLPWDMCPLVKNASGFDPECARTTPSMYFWYRMTLKASDRIEDPGTVVPTLLLILFLVWCLTALILVSGLKCLGKVMSVLALLPYFLLLSFFIRCLLLEGASLGLQHLLVFKIPVVYSMKIWCLAGNLVLSALGLGYGVIASFSSYMPSSNNCLLDAFVVTLFNLGTFLFVTPAIISCVGFWATINTQRCREKNVEILTSLISSGELPPEAKPPQNMLDNMASMFTPWVESLPQSSKEMVLSRVSDCDMQKQLLKVSEPGSNFAFLAFIEALSFIPGSSYWSIFFFLQLFTLGLSSMVGIVQGVITPLQDTCYSFRKYPKLFIVTLSLTMFVGSIFFIKSSGYYYYRLLKDHWLVLPILFIVTLETLAIAWVYGIKRLLEEMVGLVGRPVSPISCFLFCHLCPVMLLALSVVTIIYMSSEDFTYIAWDSSTSKEVVRKYPQWAVKLVISLTIFVFLPHVIYFINNLLSKISANYVSIENATRVSKPLVLRSRSPEGLKKSLPKEEIVPFKRKS